MSSVHGIGFAIGGLVLGVWGGFKRRTVTAAVGLTGVGIGLSVFGLIPAGAFGWALVVVFVRTLMVPMIRGPVMAIFQAYVPPEMQGRVFTLLLSTMSLTAPLGLAIGGPVVDLVGVRALFVAGGIGCLVIALVWVLSPVIMRLEDDVEAQGGFAGL
jgi:DHA3 family macrolide efflux protein-like MFS transporter